MPDAERLRSMFKNSSNFRASQVIGSSTNNPNNLQPSPLSPNKISSFARESQLQADNSSLNLIEARGNLESAPKYNYMNNLSNMSFTHT